MSPWSGMLEKQEEKDDISVFFLLTKQHINREWSFAWYLIRSLLVLQDRELKGMPILHAIKQLYKALTLTKVGDIKSVHWYVKRAKEAQSGVR